MQSETRLLFFLLQTVLFTSSFATQLLLFILIYNILHLPWIIIVRPPFLPTMTELYVLHTYSSVQCIHAIKRTNQQPTTERLFVKHLIGIIRALDHYVPSQQPHLSG